MGRSIAIIPDIDESMSKDNATIKYEVITYPNRDTRPKETGISGQVLLIDEDRFGDYMFPIIYERLMYAILHGGEILGENEE